MKEYENTTAAHSVRLNSVERAIEELTHITRKLADTSIDTAKTLALAMQSAEYNRKEVERNSSDILTLKTDRAFVLGSWKAICVAGAVIVGVSGVSSATCAWFAITKAQKANEHAAR